MAETISEMKAQSSQETVNLSHKRRKALWKKQKRKIKRQAEAKDRDEKLQTEEELKKQSLTFNQKLAKEEELAKAEILQIEAESQRQRELWEWHEDMYKQRLKQKAEQAERERQLKIEIEKKIKEEWEERQKKEQEEEEEKRKKKEKQVIHIKRWTWITPTGKFEGLDKLLCEFLITPNIQFQHLARMIKPWLSWTLFQNFNWVEDKLLQQAREAENKDGDWSNPLAPVQYGKERQIETCPFFVKVAACRFGERCSRSHPYPDSSRTLLFTNMFRHFQLDQGLCEEYDTDIVLEYEDSEVYQKFREFYEDTLPEFKAIGHVVQFKVCCNFQPHLRGNVYISYSREDHAFETYTKFNARWYGGKQISAQFVEIPSWRRAICGLFGKGRCPKGRECNFLHVFKNPSDEFNMADRDMEPFTPRQGYHHRNKRSRSRDRKYSPSRSSRNYRRSRSRDRYDSHRSSRRHSRKRSRSSDRHKSYSSKQRSRSPDQRSYSKRSRSRSPDQRSNSKRSRSRTPDYRSSCSRQRSRSPHRKNRSKVSKVNDRSRSQSEESTQENSPSRKSKENKVSNSQISVSVDNIESYENSVENSDKMIWVEKTIESVDNKKANKAYKLDSVGIDRSTRRIENSDSDCEENSYRKKHKKSKKHRRSKES